ncbi:hypothetical protein N9W21_05945 [Shewanella sp.]|nr:hypothetical protein [Shewanella sp.]
MFTSTLIKTVKTSALAVTLLGTSLSAQADVSPITDVMSNIERNMAAQMNEMLTKAQTELSSSIRHQVSQMVFVFDDKKEPQSESVTMDKTDKSLTTTTLNKG